MSLLGKKRGEQQNVRSGLKNREQALQRVGSLKGEVADLERTKENALQEAQNAIKERNIAIKAERDAKSALRITERKIEGNERIIATLEKRRDALAQEVSDLHDERTPQQA